MANHRRFGAATPCIQGGRIQWPLVRTRTPSRLREGCPGSALSRAISAPRPSSKESPSESSSKPSSDMRATMACSSYGSIATSAGAVCGPTVGPASGRCFATSRAATAISAPYCSSDPSRWGRFHISDESACLEYACGATGIEIHYCAEGLDGDETPLSSITRALTRRMAGEYGREAAARGHRAVRAADGNSAAPAGGTTPEAKTR